MSDYISEEVLIQILKCLPARNLVRLRSVCKSWKELIDSDELMLKHLALQKPGFLVEYESGNRLIAVELGCQPLIHDVRYPIQGGRRSFYDSFCTHHGIVCFDEGDRNIFLWNPSTGKLSNILPPTDFSVKKDHWMSDRGWCKSFFIDPITKEYQILILDFQELDEDGRVIVNGILYSSTEKNWSVIPGLEIDWESYFRTGDLYQLVGGVAYWADERLEAVLSFDFSQKTLELIERSKFGSPLHFIQWKGAFSVLCRSPKFKDTYEIQTRMEGSWVSMFRFKIPSPKPPEIILAMAGTDQRFWVLYDTDTDSNDRSNYHRDIYLYESGVGCTRLTQTRDEVPAISHDFVESLLFP